MERSGSSHPQFEEAPLRGEHGSRQGSNQCPCRKEHAFIGGEEALLDVKLRKFTK